MNGPYETESQARDAVRSVHAAFRANPGIGHMLPHNHRMLEESCTRAGIQLGAYDHRILVWLAGCEPATCAVIAGLISRAASPASDDIYPHNPANITCPGSGIKCVCWDLAFG